MAMVTSFGTQIGLELTLDGRYGEGSSASDREKEDRNGGFCELHLDCLNK
jgi:hypothetical protein